MPTTDTNAIFPGYVQPGTVIKICEGCDATLLASDPDLCERCDMHGSPKRGILPYSKRCP